MSDVRDWIRGRGGIAHRHDAVRAGHSLAAVRAVMRMAGVAVLRRAWIALPEAPADLVLAARAGGRVGCISLARRRQWWMPEDVEHRTHLHVLPGSGSSGHDSTEPVHRHWTIPLAPIPTPGLLSSVEDALSHIAQCLPYDAALAVWESAIRVEKLHVDAIRTIPWRTLAARSLAEDVQGLADSGLEMLVVIPLRRTGLRIRQQVVIARRPVDVLVGERLVIQIDGYEFHSSSAQRAKDIAHDAELRLRGYTVLRFSYAQIVHNWPAVEAVVRRAVAARLHASR
ncbi:endonuclease domain-containing protein [Microbacterium sp. P01]|uniref:endonuclease domain-containing protein n=1 Tax=Microbacterium sp. P01 TaxID=3366261 RepID=UPI00366DB1F8